MATQGAPPQTSMIWPVVRKATICSMAAGVLRRVAVGVVAGARRLVRVGRHVGAAVPQQRPPEPSWGYVERGDAPPRVDRGRAAGGHDRAVHRDAERAGLHLGGDVGDLVVAERGVQQHLGARACRRTGRRSGAGGSRWPRRESQSIWMSCRPERPVGRRRVRPGRARPGTGRSRRCGRAAARSWRPGTSSTARVKSWATAVVAPPMIPPWLMP